MTVRILCLEDEVADLKLMEAVLIEAKIECEIVRVETGEEFVASLENGEFDLILSDYALPAFDGRRALNIARELRPSLPFILVSGRLGEEYAIDSLKDGATDYVLKQRLERLAPAVSRALAEAEERKNRLRMEEELRQKEAQFRQSQKMEVVGRLAGGIAHEFNNLLTVIQSYTELIMLGLPPGHPVCGHAELVMEASDRAAALTRQLLIVSRKQVYEPKDVNLNEIVSGMEKMLRPLIGQEIALTCVLHPQLGTVRVDPAHMEQVIMNLVVNARDAMPEGGKLTIETATVELDEADVELHQEAGPCVMLTVSDTGTGMDAETRSRIFEPFFSTKDVGEGTGLGLSTVCGIVEQSGGSIHVVSEPGQGAAFKIYFRRVDEPGEELEPAAEPDGVVTGTEVVLVVEDEELLRTLVLGILRAHGYQVLEAQDGSDALRICAQYDGKIDLLVTDVVMPGMSGGEVAKRLKVMYPEMGVLFVSGYAGYDDGAFKRALVDEDGGFLQKPYKPARLAAKVREILDARREGCD